MQVSTDGPYITTTDGSTVRFWDAASFNAIKEVGLSLSVECASLLERRTSMWWVARMRAFFCACINLCNMGWYSARIPQKYAANCVAKCHQRFGLLVDLFYDGSAGRCPVDILKT